ncbi:hypothetical protein ACWDRR_00665 [Kitasatospora sp. NPDC003701]
MSKPGKARFKLETIRTKATANETAVIDFEHLDGEVYEVPTPAFWTDAVHEALRAEDLPGAGRALLGDRYAPFIEAGGRSTDLMLIIRQYAEDQGVTLGE